MQKNGLFSQGENYILFIPCGNMYVPFKEIFIQIMTNTDD